MTKLAPQGTLQALTDDDLAGGSSLSEEDRTFLLELAVHHLSLYVREIGPIEFYEELLANVGRWRLGWNQQDDCYWATPSTADGFYIRGIGGGTAVFKWKGRDFLYLKERRQGEEELVRIGEKAVARGAV